MEAFEIFVYVLPGLVVPVSGDSVICDRSAGRKYTFIRTSPYRCRGLRYTYTTILYAVFDLGGQYRFLICIYKNICFKDRLAPADKISEKLARFSVDKGIFIGVMLLILGIIMSVSAVAEWREVGYKDLIPEDMMRIAIPSITAVFIGAQFIFSSFFIGILTIKTKEGV